ncbi:glycerol-3-phosphate acyltransferase [Candidatus Thorarchaeota archaeon]|nr:MAG: glycerol-3-phosphate acyltransferase [Candidatus Thorarchaeota archaeon]
MGIGYLILALLIGYLAGSISFARIITHIFAPEADIADLKIDMENGEGEEIVGIFGANASAMILGPKLGLTVAALDMLKVIVPMLIVKYTFPIDTAYLFASIGGLLGHNWPLYHRFRGGRGFAVIFGSFLVVQWYAPLLTTLTGLFLGMVIIGNPMISYILWLWLMIPWMVFFGTTWETVYVIATVVIFHIGTIPEMNTTFRLMRSGKYKAYVDAMYNSSPRWRGMKKMADRLWILKPILERRTKAGEDQSTSFDSMDGE